MELNFSPSKLVFDDLIYLGFRGGVSIRRFAVQCSRELCWLCALAINSRLQNLIPNRVSPTFVRPYLFWTLSPPSRGGGGNIDAKMFYFPKYELCINKTGIKERIYASWLIANLHGQGRFGHDVTVSK